MQHIQTILDNYEDNIIALSLHLELIPSYEDTHTFHDESQELTEYIAGLDEAKELIDNGEYLSLTDEEADELQEQYLETYIDDIIITEIPQEYQCYFDREAWKSDARTDGRGHAIASYDGEENMQRVNGIMYYIYRIN